MYSMPILPIGSAAHDRHDLAGIERRPALPSGLVVDTTAVGPPSFSPTSSGPITSQPRNSISARSFEDLDASSVQASSLLADRFKLRRTVSYDPQVTVTYHQRRELSPTETDPEDDAASYRSFTRFVGPLSELHSALEAVEVAASKAGNGMGTFCYKLYALLIDPAHRQLCSFSANGQSFLVYDTVRFAHEVLPKQFKHCNFASFVRQLNMYAFHKVNRFSRNTPKDTVYEFAHPMFVYGRPQLLDEIKRKVPPEEGKLAKRNRLLPTGATSDAENRPSKSTKVNHVGGIAPHQVDPAAAARRNSSLPVVAGPPLTTDGNAISQPQRPSTASSLSNQPRQNAAPIEFPTAQRIDSSMNSPTTGFDRLEQLELEYINLRFDYEALESRLHASERRNTEIVEVFEDLWASLHRVGIPMPYPFPSTLLTSDTSATAARRPSMFQFSNAVPTSSTAPKEDANPDQHHEQTNGSSASHMSGTVASHTVAGPHSAPPTTHPFDLWTHQSPLLGNSNSHSSPGTSTQHNASTSGLHVELDRTFQGASFHHLTQGLPDLPSPHFLAPAVPRSHSLAPPYGTTQPRRSSMIHSPQPTTSSSVLAPLEQLVARDPDRQVFERFTSNGFNSQRHDHDEGSGLSQGHSHGGQQTHSSLHLQTHRNSLHVVVDDVDHQEEGREQDVVMYHDGHRSEHEQRSHQHEQDPEHRHDHDDGSSGQYGDAREPHSAGSSSSYFSDL